MIFKEKSHCYRIFGMSVSCDIDLQPCPKTRAARQIEICKKIGKVAKPHHIFHVIRYPNRKVYAQFARQKNGYLVIFPRQGIFEISKSGRRVRYELQQNLSPNEKLILIAHHLLPLLLSLNGQLVLHGAAVAKGRQVHLILGSAGMGKSTMAHYLYRRGFKVMSDDAVLIKKIGQSFCISGSTPIIRVWRGKGKTLIKTAGTRGSRSWRPLHAIHFPQLSSKLAQPKHLSALEGLQNLLPHVFRMDVESKSLTTKEFKALSQLSTAVSMYVWPYSHKASSLRRTQDWLVKLSRRP